MPPRKEAAPAEPEAEPLHWPTYDHEERCQALFRELTKLFKKIEVGPGPLPLQGLPQDEVAIALTVCPLLHP